MTGISKESANGYRLGTDGTDTRTTRSSAWVNRVRVKDRRKITVQATEYTIE